ncbi:hypothetical protein NEDG_01936 [Nematocida displodere]|uniref:Uncharacterized protein n=1 Tax=Nematocida displodere TaxID=1805483 RepID=A0A177EK99_9MICR|nr:hypothetical protein NEDG_01936 [Nematocida displodere]
MAVERRTKEAILAESRPGRVVIVVGETGSGKSTEVPQIFIRANPEEKVVVTQPRRVAAISLARRVGFLMEDVGKDVVGYTVRFQDSTKKSTRLKYVTDGILLRWIEQKKEVRTVILDEVHERSVRTDVLIGLLKERISTTRLILMSATADTEALSAYFEKSGVEVKVIRIEGRAFPVSIKYLPKKASDYIQLAYEVIKKILKETAPQRPSARLCTTTEPVPVPVPEPNPIDSIFSSGSGSGSGAPCAGPSTGPSTGPQTIVRSGTVLVFLSGLEDIEDLYKLIAIFPDVEILRLHSTLSDSEQSKVFKRREKRIRVILSTNIAETSLTIPDVKWVVDTGVQKIGVSREGVDALGIVKISKSSAKQRAGRAGRLGPGTCFRLYTEDAFHRLEENNTPEILRTDISSVCLTLVSGGISPEAFDFLEAPAENVIVSSLRELFILGLITKDKKITELGKKVVTLPLSPALGRFLIVGKTLGVPCTAASICAVLSLEVLSLLGKESTVSIASVWEQPMKESDLTVAASLFFTFAKVPSRQRKEFCSQAGLSLKEMVKAEQIYHQVLSLIGTKHTTTECHAPEETAPAMTQQLPKKESLTEKYQKNEFVQLLPQTADSLHAAASGAFLTRVAESMKNGGYLHLYSKATVFVHPSSVMFRKREEMVSFILTSQTTKAYILYVFPFMPASLPLVLAQA